ncbi:hypothetical protein [Acidovorax sp. SUPP2539]|uniref:hypothetical protein n=1 Tax=Acidovorax sp. SUPP2539 TaxID=2920878 RepID=UPI0023DE2F1E|nr:hypothetical protein [Acidovorax sp. SUPP2539]GKS92615.1 hypothetical protein AVTE2539_24640 [Acidovorax sp. SUPP2539]
MAQRKQIEITAYHEAGHAVMAMSAGFLVTEVSCQASNSGFGHTAWQMPLPMSDASRVGAVLTLASGMAADCLHWSSLADKDEQEQLMGHNGDRLDARIHLAALSQGEVFDDYLSYSIGHLKKVDVWGHVVALAELLKTIQLINGLDLLNRFRQCVPSISAHELGLLKRAVDLKYGDQT